MKTNYKFLIVIVFLLILVGVFYMVNPFKNSADKNLENEIAEVTLKATDLVNTFSNDEEKSNHLYAGKIIEVTGTIKEITFLNNRNTIILNSNSDTFGVICDINPKEKEKLNQLKQHQKITIKGICKGFLKDVILLNCTIDLPTNE